MSETEPELVPVKEAAEALHMTSRAFLRAWRGDQREVLKVTPHALRIRRSDFESWIRERWEKSDTEGEKTA